MQRRKTRSQSNLKGGERVESSSHTKLRVPNSAVSCEIEPLVGEIQRVSSLRDLPEDTYEMERELRERDTTSPCQNVGKSRPEISPNCGPTDSDILVEAVGAFDLDLPESKLPSSSDSPLDIGPGRSALVREVEIQSNNFGLDSAVFDALAQVNPLWRVLPTQVHEMWISIVQPWLSQYLAADDEFFRTTLLLSFLDLPAQHLQTPHGSGARGIRTLKRSLAARQPIEVPSRPGSGPDSKPASQKTISRVVGLMNRGLIGKAMRTLSQGPIAPATQQTLSDLRLLHPRRSGDIRRSGERRDIDILLTVDPQAIAAIVRRMCTGAAPGPSGWTAELLLPLVTDDECLSGLSEIIKDMCNGRLRGEARERLCAAKLIGLRKQQPNGGTRPIAMGEVLYKIAGQYQLSLIPNGPGSMFPKIQFGVGIKAGIDKAFHETTMLLEEKDDQGGERMALLIDFCNAFNSVSRHAIDRALQKAGAPLARLRKFFLWSYDEPSILGFYDGSMLMGVINSESGVKQGDPLGPFLFALAAQSVFEKACEECKGVAFLDDFTLVGSARALANAFRILESEAAMIGLQMNRTKCKIFAPKASKKFCIPVEGVAETMAEATVQQSLPNLKTKIRSLSTTK